MLKIDFHIHSIASGHALNTVYELIDAAITKNLTHIGIVEHGPSMRGAPHEGYFWISNKLSNNLKGVEVFLGIEANILDKSGKIDLDGDLLQCQRIVMAGLHDKTPYRDSGCINNTESIINAMKNPSVKIITHPYRPEFPIYIEKIVEVAYETGTLLEINDNLFSRKGQLDELIENYSILINLCKKYKMPVILGSDAHLAEKIGCDENIKAVWHNIGLDDSIILNNNPKLLLDSLKLSSLSSACGNSLQ